MAVMGGVRPKFQTVYGSQTGLRLDEGGSQYVHPSFPGHGSVTGKVVQGVPVA